MKTMMALVTDGRYTKPDVWVYEVDHNPAVTAFDGIQNAIAQFAETEEGLQVCLDHNTPKITHNEIWLIPDEILIRNGIRRVSELTHGIVYADEWEAVCEKAVEELDKLYYGDGNNWVIE